MKKEIALACIFWGLALLVLFAAIPAANAENLYDSVIRIHVLANSDSDHDQETKLMVRDRLLSYAREHFSLAENREEAKSEAEKRIPEMEKVCREALAETGEDLPVSLQLTEEYYPTRHYESVSLPAGNYLSLQVRIGKAEGQNWWCILFPPMCLGSASKAEDALADAGMEEENVKTVTGGGTQYQIRFKLLEILEEAKEKLRRIF